MTRHAVERLWGGEGTGASAARAALWPLEIAYGAVIAGRNTLYDRGVLPVHATGVPAASIGNLSVGGTGKTPIASWWAGELARRGARPAIVTRGYGADEPQVHAQLSEDIQVIVDADRVSGALSAKRAGCDVVVFDDAFQHRRVQRDVDVVLVAAEHFSSHPRLLPAGPWREPLRALRRASLVIVTRKAADRDAAQRVAWELSRVAPDVPLSLVSLALDELRSLSGLTSGPLSMISGRRLLAVTAIGDPSSFEAQLREAGAHVELNAFRDHHAFTQRDTEGLAERGRQFDGVICTLKDAVKLAAVWPRNGPAMWYVSQRVSLEMGATFIEAAVQRLLDARP
jgi:tetraacyldisaccharide 4'-kinase